MRRVFNRNAINKIQNEGNYRTNIPVFFSVIAMGKNKGKEKTYILNKTEGTHQPNMICGPCLDFNSDILYQ